MEICEIRIPTYKRPSLLQRAIESLITQTHTYWRAVIMDDSPEEEGKIVVEKFKDNRLQYAPNPHNLGCSGNINQAFSSKSLLGGEYACVLEDDNWLLPTFLSENINSLRTHDINLLLRNQKIWLQDQDIATPTDKTTRGYWFTARNYNPLELHAYLFFMEGISNGGLFWRTRSLSNLQVSSKVTDSGLQEYCRTLQICEPVRFEPYPLCCWSKMTSEQSLRNPIADRIFSRGTQSIRRKLLSNYGESIVLEASRIAEFTHQYEALEHSLLDALFVSYKFKELKVNRQVQKYIKSCLKLLSTQNPLANYIDNLTLNSTE